MLIEFKETRRYSPDGFTVMRGVTGQVVDVAHTAACQLINDGHAVRVEPKKSQEEVMAEILASLRVNRGQA